MACGCFLLGSGPGSDPTRTLGACGCWASARDLRAPAERWWLGPLWDCALLLGTTGTGGRLCVGAEKGEEVAGGDEEL